MRCEECGRVMKNAQMWQLGGDIHAPTSRSMRQLCWECRERASAPSATDLDAVSPSDAILAQANEVVREYESRSV
ncbi:MAG TPA: hypothetical protein VF812_14215 [Ktedonobacterales bacterium]